jgi:hypothetical protein
MNAAATVYNAHGGYVIAEVFKEAVRKGAPKGTNGGHAALQAGLCGSISYRRCIERSASKCNSLPPGTTHALRQC